MSNQASKKQEFKKCSRCLKDLGLEQFHRKERRKDGSYRLESACKKCRSKKYRLKKVNRTFSGEFRVYEAYDFDYVKEDLTSFLGDLALSIAFGIDDEK